jgi:excisionase family DNA binding protein
MTVSEAAAYCDVDPKTFYAWLSKGALPHVVVGPNRSIRVPRHEVEKLVQVVPVPV